MLTFVFHCPIDIRLDLMQWYVGCNHWFKFNIYIASNHHHETPTLKAMFLYSVTMEDRNWIKAHVYWLVCLCFHKHDMCFHAQGLNDLTLCRRVTPCGDRALRQLWLKYCLVAWWHQTITWKMFTYLRKSPVTFTQGQFHKRYLR